MRNQNYVIYSKKEDGYWDNEIGWVDEVDEERSTTMIFTNEDRSNLRLPIGGQWEPYQILNR